MTPIQLVLSFKIGVTVLFALIPLIAHSKQKKAKRYGVSAESRLIFNLYAASLCALLVNYGFGLQQTMQGVFPAVVVYVGIVSNIGAAIVMIIERFFYKEARSPVADITAICVFGGIGILFIGASLYPDVFSTNLW